MRFFNKKSVSLSWFISYIIIIMIATFVNMYTYHVAEEKVFRQINAIQSEVLERRRVQIDNLQRNVANLATELSHDEKVRWLMGEETVSSEFLYNMLYIKEYITTWENLENDVKRIYIYLNNTDYVVDRAIAQKSEFYYKLRYSNMSMSAEDFRTLLMEGPTGKYVKIADKNEKDTQGNVIYVFSVFSTDFFKPEATIAVELSSDTLLEGKNGDSHVGDICILDKNNQIFLSSADNENRIEECIKEINFNESKGIYIADDKVILFTKSLQNDWKYLSIIDKDEYLNDLSSIRLLNYIMLGIYVIMGVALAFYMSLKNRKPILEIMEQLSDENGDPAQNDDGNELKFINRRIVDLLEKKEEQNNKIKTQSLIVKDAVFNELLRGKNLSEVSLKELLASVGVSLKKPHFTVVMFDIDASELFFEETSESEDNRKLSKLIISNILGELLSDEMTYVFCNLNDAFICIINSETTGVAVRIKESLEKTLELVRMNFNLNFVSGISSVHKGYYGLRTCYNEASECMEYRLFVKQDVIEYEFIKERETCLYYFPIEKEIQMISALKSGDRKLSLEILNQIFDENFSRAKPQTNMAKYLVYDIMGSVLKVLNDFGEADGDNIFEQFRIFERISNCKTVENIKTEFTDIFREICEKTITENIEKSKRSIEAIKEYIDKHYNDSNLSGAMISSYFKINQSSLSTLFKKYTGEGLLEYIIKVRMNKALELLSDSDETIEKISEAVGYINVRTFRRTFKKIYGFNPSTYRDAAADNNK